jgi:alpha,alpha-trehalose phosphorylase
MYHADAIWMVHQTVNTGFSVACAIKNVLPLPTAGQEFSDGAWTGYQYDLNVQQGEPVELDKMIAYITSLDIEAAQLVPGVLAELDRAVSSGSEALFAEQREYLAGFWDSADIQIEGDDELQRAIRFNMYHLLQAAGKDGRSNIAAKGLTGLGYEGHYFWDTEVYILPFFLYTQPGISRKLLEYRYHILDKARQRARQMAHPSGALYSWRTIDGEECSANFPTGTAQYHINADIAFAIQRYYDATLDVDFMKRFGVEILCETARLWLEVGDFIPARGGRFCINAVTGPDEYQILVNNNAYTNLMARENLRFASEIASWLKQVDPVAYEDLARRISLSDTEHHAWQKAADLMVIPTMRRPGSSLRTIVSSAKRSGILPARRPRNTRCCCIIIP